VESIVLKSRKYLHERYLLGKSYFTDCTSLIVHKDNNFLNTHKFSDASGFIDNLIEVIRQQSSNPQFDINKAMVSVLTFSAFHAWDKYKQEYIFDENLMESLWQTDFLEKQLPNSILKKVPFDSFFIAEPYSGHPSEEVAGWFVNKSEYKEGVGLDMLRLSYYPSTGDCSLHPYTINLNDNNYENAILERGVWNKLQDAGEVIKKGLLLVLYLCSKNAEVSKVYEVRKRSLKRKHHTFTSNVSKVGEYVGRFLKKQKYRSEKRDAETGRTVRSHCRRGHWHHYWLGPRDSADRKRELKWVQPTFVNANKGKLNTRKNLV
jgi:hypothetical protein